MFTPLSDRVDDLSKQEVPCMSVGRTQSRCLHIVYSSIASSLGLARASDYAAENAYLDALVPGRAKQAFISAPVSWGAVAQIGLAWHVEMQNVIEACYDPFSLGFDIGCLS